MAVDVDTVVIGAGVVGLAVACQMAQSGRSVLVLEAGNCIGSGISGRSSEVIHAGIYYPKKSLKAKLCVRGKSLLYDFCETHKISHSRIGKLLVATDDSQLVQLEKLYYQGLSNSVDDLRMLEGDELEEMEPELSACKAVYSPSTGIVSSYELMLALQGELERLGGSVVVLSPVVSGEVCNQGFRLKVGGSEPIELVCRELINSAGLESQSVSRSIRGIPAASIPEQYLSKGSYFNLLGNSPFSRLIYPLPSEEGLGIHLTIDLQGRTRLGPDTEWVDEASYGVDSDKAVQFCKVVQRYYPALQVERLGPAYAGIRPKIVKKGVGDFRVSSVGDTGVPGWVALYGIESPGLTASLAIGEYVLKIIS